MSKDSMSLMLDRVEWTRIAWAEEPEDTEDCVPYATHEGVLNIGGYALRCYQLSNGERVFDATDIENFFNGAREGGK